MFTLNIETDNAAFEEYPERELSRILRRIADEIEFWDLVKTGQRPIRDENGNTVGHYVLKPTQPGEYKRDLTAADTSGDTVIANPTQQPEE